MSYQSQIPILSQPPPPIAPAAKGKRHKGLLVLGLLLLLGGVLGGGAIATKGMSNYKEAVKSLARAPVGCTTTLVFDKPATFTVYIEKKGKLGGLSGDCEATTAYNHPGDQLPKVSLILKGADGAEVDMQRGVTASYDVGGYVGQALRSLKIEQAGTYKLDVESDDTDFAVAIGKNPKADNERLMQIGGGVALGGFVLGLLFLLLGLRRRRAEVAPVADPLGYTPTPMPGWPPGPYAWGPPSAPPASQPGFRPQPAPGPQPIRLPEQPPIRPPERPLAAFAPPTFAPPPPPSVPPPVSPPEPEDAGWTMQRPEPDDAGWTLPGKRDDTRGDDD